MQKKIQSNKNLIYKKCKKKLNKIYDGDNFFI